MSRDVTKLLEAVRAGRASAEGDLIAVMYDDLRALARDKMNRERRGHTLSPTELVHEVYSRLKRQGAIDLARDEHHFRMLIAQAMRRLLIDHARRRGAAKRTPPPPNENDVSEAPAFEPLRLDVAEAIDALAAQDPRAADVVRLRCYASMTTPEVALTLNVSVATTERDLQFGKRFLGAHLAPALEPEP
ncbi:MAG: ECF-type sigma factor [Phycisphaerales bacterium]